MLTVVVRDGLPGLDTLGAKGSHPGPPWPGPSGRQRGVQVQRRPGRAYRRVMATPLELHGHPIPGHPAPRRPGERENPPPKAKPVSTPRIPSKTVTRQAMAAQQAAAATPSPTPKAFQPWASVIQHAEQRMRGRLALALAELEHHMAMAGQVLDVAEQAAKEAESQILAAAWARWHQDLDAAADTSAAILNPARKAYAELVAAAGADYDRDIAEARLAYEAELSRAESARALAASMPESTAARAAG